jgi:hypothetical protein
MMLTEILSIISLGSAVVSVLGMKRAQRAQRLAEQHSTEAGKHCESALQHKDASQRAALASHAQNKIAQALSKLKGEPAQVVRSRADLYDEINRTAAAREDKDAIAAANKENSSPTWLKKWTKPAE